LGLDAQTGLCYSAFIAQTGLLLIFFMIR
jgi:hypothetical protein